MSKTLGIEDFAKKAGIEAASARVMLRKLKAKKTGKTYEFKNVSEMEALIAKAREGKSTKKPAKKVAKKAAKKPAPKKKAPASE